MKQNDKVRLLKKVINLGKKVVCWSTVRGPQDLTCSSDFISHKSELASVLRCSPRLMMIESPPQSFSSSVGLDGNSRSSVSHRRHHHCSNPPAPPPLQQPTGATTIAAAHRRHHRHISTSPASSPSQQPPTIPRQLQLKSTDLLSLSTS
ncbi:hypothetical protein L1887_35270 [Cichorium endivia]|nr:hypothetical protein L1887_35270 [Cichorium endivia]